MRRLDRPALYWTMTLALVVVMAWTVLDVVGIDFRYAFTWSDLPFSMEVSHTTKAVPVSVYLGRFVPDFREKLKMPAGVEIEGTLPVNVALGSPDMKGWILGRLATVPLDVLFLVIVLHLRKMALSSIGTSFQDGNPFVWANVRRLRIIAAMFLLWPLVSQWSQIAAFELVDQPPLQGAVSYWWDVSIVPLQLGVFLLLLVLAEVFAAGIRLREDTEGLV